MNNNSTLMDLLIFILYCLMYCVIGIPLLFLGLIFSILLLPIFVILKCISALTDSQAVCRFNNNLENTSLNVLGVGSIIIQKMSELIDTLR
jgi:hypothetical protein